MIKETAIYYVQTFRSQPGKEEFLEGVRDLKWEKKRRVPWMRLKRQLGTLKVFEESRLRTLESDHSH